MKSKITFLLLFFVATNTFAQCWQSIKAGHGITLALKNDGTIWYWGKETTTPNYKTLPVKIGNDNDWSFINVKDKTLIAIKNNGTLWMWGFNHFGQLGVNTTTLSDIPLQVGTENNWTSKIDSYYHTVAIKNDGTLWAWGDNASGQLGTGNNNNQLVPIQIGTDSDWKEVSVDRSYTLAIKNNGTLWAWGFSAYGALGVGTTNIPTQIGTDTNWDKISANNDRSYAIKTDGTLWSWGYNYYGALGIGSLSSSVSVPTMVSGSGWVAISAGYDGCVAKKNDGTIWSFGRSTVAQLGISTFYDKTIPTKIGTNNDWSSISVGWRYTVALKNDGSYWAWGSNYLGQLGNESLLHKSTPYQINNCTEIQTPTSCFKEIYAGDKCTYAIGTDNTLWSWGSNTNGKLGIGYTFPIVNYPFKVGNQEWHSLGIGENHVVASTYDRNIFAWGYGYYGQSVNNAFVTTTSSPVQIYTPSVAADDYEAIPLLNAGASVSFGLVYGGRILSKGYYNDSKLGREYSLALPGNNQYPVYFQLNEVQTSSIEYYNLPMHWKDIKAQRGNTTSADIVALKKDGTLWKWGTSSTYPTQIGTQKDWDELSSASATTFIKKTDGTWWVMGSNYAGIFGNNTTTNSTTPISIGNQWKSISCGYYHVIAIHNDGTLWAWGLNDNGQLGNGTTTNSSVPVQISTDTNWYKTSAGLDHSVAIKRDGSLYAWGLNDKGQLGDLTTISKLTPTLISCPSILLAVENFGFKNNEVEIYPNPTTDFINISSKEKINTAEIYDINGRILLKTNKVEDKIFLENLNAGIYLLKLQFENGSIETQKIIKR